MFEINSIDFEKYVNRITKVFEKDKNGRYKSYEHIRNAFIKNYNKKNKIEFISLHLYAYLASWGMLRNSFLMQKDYSFLIPIVKVLCKERYNKLFFYNPFETDKNVEYINIIVELYDEIRLCFKKNKYYTEKQEEKNVSPTKTLITKIILGTYGCTVAYDSYVVKSLSYYGILQKPNFKSLDYIQLFAFENKESIEKIMLELNRTNLKMYTPMKIVDMYLFSKGIELCSNSNKSS